MNRDDLARIGAVVGVEYLPQAAHCEQRIRGKNELDVSDLVEANSVLAGNGSAGVNTSVHDVAHRPMNPLTFIGIVSVVRDVRMKVSVSRVEDVADCQPIRICDLRNSFQYLREFRPRNKLSRAGRE